MSEKGKQTKRVVRGVAEIVLNVENLNTMTSFYRDVLGFPVHSHYPDEEPTIVFLTIQEGDSVLSLRGHPLFLGLIDARRHQFTRETYAGLSTRHSTLNHLAFEIKLDDFESEVARLRSLGLEVKVSEFPNFSARGLFFKDPEGNMIELICHDPLAR